MISARGVPCRPMLLVPEMGGKRTMIICADAVTFGRTEADIAIADERIRRGQLRISLFVGGAMAEADGAARGTLLRGEPLSSARLADGDVLDLAGAMRLEVRLFAGLDAGGESAVSALVSSPMDDILLLRAAVRCACTDAGLIFSATGDCAFSIESGAVVFRTPVGAQFVHPGGTLEYGGARFAEI